MLLITACVHEPHISKAKKPYIIHTTKIDKTFIKMCRHSVLWFAAAEFGGSDGHLESPASVPADMEFSIHSKN